MKNTFNKSVQKLIEDWFNNRPDEPLINSESKEYKAHRKHTQDCPKCRYDREFLFGLYMKVSE